MALKWAKMRNAEEELNVKLKEIDILKNLLVKEVADRQAWKEQVDRVKAESHMAMAKFTEHLIGFVVDKTFENIKNRFVLVPKECTEYPYLGGKNILGHYIPSAVVKEINKEKSKE